jgi:hypothetical protein
MSELEVGLKRIVLEWRDAAISAQAVEGTIDGIVVGYVFGVSVRVEAGADIALRGQVPVAHGWNFRALEDVPVRVVPAVITSEDEYFFR